ncbi:MAG: hypothetical protein FJ276_19305 [Planctomycetes bacterium]|nr:hypothetical protein [Planctomycetota bacterium]
MSIAVVLDELEPIAAFDGQQIVHIPRASLVSLLPLSVVFQLASQQLSRLGVRDDRLVAEFSECFRHVHFVFLRAAGRI